MTDLPPSIMPGDLPLFHALGEYRFQDLCCDLFEAEQSIATCAVYGTRGQLQRGIDLLAHREDGDCIEVGQCKCYAQFPPADIRAASNEFFNHWDYWSDRKVEQFILFVACDLATTRQQDEIIRKRERFAQYGIRYEVWSARNLRSKLRPHHGIVATCFHHAEYWIQEITGVSLIPTTVQQTSRNPTFDVSSSILSNQLNELAAGMSADIEQKLLELRRAWQEGNQEVAITWVREIKSTRWTLLPPNVKIKILSFEGNLQVELGN